MAPLEIFVKKIYLFSTATNDKRAEGSDSEL